MKRTFGSFFIAVLLHLPASAHLSGNELLQKIDGDSSDRLAALFYIHGVVDGTTQTMIFFKAARDHYKDQKSSYQLVNNTTGICIPEKVSLGQLVDIVAKGLREYPDSRHFDASLLIATYVKNAFPCAE